MLTWRVRFAFFFVRFLFVFFGQALVENLTAAVSTSL